MNASELLQIWEVGRSLPPLERLLLLLAGAGWSDAASLTIGHKNRALLSLRESLFGSQMDCIVDCPQCGEKLEFTLATATLAAPEPAEPGNPLTVEHDGYTLTVRQPQLRDLRLAQGEPDALFTHCVVEARRAEAPVAVEELPGATRRDVAQALQAADPLLDIQLALACSACGEQWQSPLDLLGYLWQEIEQWGQRMLRTVHRLASAYGWSEGEILALSAWRRARYLTMVHDG